MQRIRNHPCNRREVDDLAIFFMADRHRFNQFRIYAVPELLSGVIASDFCCVRKRESDIATRPETGEKRAAFFDPPIAGTKEYPQQCTNKPEIVDRRVKGRMDGANKIKLTYQPLRSERLQNRKSEGSLANAT